MHFYLALFRSKALNRNATWFLVRDFHEETRFEVQNAAEIRSNTPPTPRDSGGVQFSSRLASRATATRESVQAPASGSAVTRVLARITPQTSLSKSQNRAQRET